MTVQKIIFQYEPEKENLLKVIKEINEQEGFFSLESAKRVAHHFDLKTAEVFSVASFYDQIKTNKLAACLIQVCDGANCQTREADKIIKAIEIFLRQKEGDNNNLKFKLERISCLGRCLQGPNVIINGTVYEKMDAGKTIEIVQHYF